MASSSNYRPKQTDSLAYSYWARPQSIGMDPDEELPLSCMHPRVAKQIVADVLELDFNPRLNLASWLTSIMDEEAEDLIRKALNVNAIDTVQYRSAAKLAQRCVRMLGNLWNAPPDFIGTDTVGSTEGCYLGLLAMKKQWQRQRRTANLPIDNPNLIVGSNAQIAWKKGCSYFDIEYRCINIDDNCLVLDPDKVSAVVDERTVGIAAMVGSTYTGEFEDVNKLNQVLENVKSSTGFDIPIHVDAAGGGLFAPLMTPSFIFDFRLQHVKSISFSGHKYGLVYPGVAFVIFRSQEWVPDDMKFSLDYLGELETHICLNFSRNAAFVVAQYYNFIRLGREGYTQIFSNLMCIYHYLVEKLEGTEHFKILSKADLPVLAFQLRPELDKPYTEFDIMHRLKEHRFFVPAYKMAPNAEHIRCLRVCIKIGFDLEMADSLFKALLKCISWLDQHSEKGGKFLSVTDTDGGLHHGMC